MEEIIADPAMVGMPIRYCCCIYVIEEVNYCGDYTVVRFDSKRRVWQRTSVQPNPNHKSQWRCWEIVGQWHQKRLRIAIVNAERLHPKFEDCPSARKWRKARAYRGVLKRFFRRIQLRAKIKSKP